MHLFYHPDLSENLITVTSDESRHISVLRLKPGESLYITDGKGLLCKAMIADSSTKACQLQVMERYENYNTPEYSLHIAISPTKQMERFEWFLEKATEIGINKITPVICSHAERRELKTDRLQKILQSAMKQSLKAYLPKLNEAESFEQFLKHVTFENKYIANAPASEKNHLKNFIEPKENMLVLIGPEGDFTEKEIMLAAENGFKPVSLGASRLRTETAGVYIAASVSLINS